MSGELESTKQLGDTIDNRVVEINRVLDEYTQKLGINTKRVVPDATEYLEMTEEAMQKITDEDCAIAGAILSKLALYVQQESNRHTANMNWAEANISIITAPYIDDYGGYGYKEKLPKAIRGNPAAMKLNKIQVEAKLRVDELAFVSARLDKLAYAFMFLRDTKRRVMCHDQL